MASKIKVDQIEGSAGSSITIPSGQTLTVTDGLAASTIASGTLADARIPNLNASKINAGTLADAQIPNLNASKINAGTIPVARGGTGVTSLGAAGTALKVNSGGSALEFGAVASKIIGMEKVYHSTTAVAFTNQSGTSLGANSIYYPVGLRIGGTYNKQVSNSHIRVQGWYNFHHSSSNIHGMVAWRDGQTGSIRNFNHDARDKGWYGASNGSWSMAYDVWFDGSVSAQVQGTGNMTFYVAGAVSGTRTHTHELNANGYSNSIENQSDRPNYGGFSSMIVTEYEA